MTTALKTARHFGAGVVRRPKGTPAPTPPPDRTGLSIQICETWYRVARLRVQDPDVTKALRLRKPDGTTYDVHVDQHGAHCTCGDGTFRCEGTAESCKHVRSLKAWGILP
jgi:hypothetical protein